MSPNRAKFLELIEQGVITINEDLVTNLINWLSDSEVLQFAEANQIPGFDEEEDDEEDGEFGLRSW